MSGIATYLNKIKNARLGREVRDAIHDAIATTYEDAVTTASPNAEVASARGTFANLKARLDDVDSTIEDDETLIEANTSSITSLGNRVTALEGIGAWGNMVFNTWIDAASAWAKCDFTQTISQGNILLFYVQDLENSRYYNAIFAFYNTGVFFIQNFTPTKSIWVQFFAAGYCQVKLEGFTQGGAIYRIVKIL